MERYWGWGSDTVFGGPVLFFYYSICIKIGERMVAQYSGGHGIRGDTVFGGTRYSNFLL